MGFVKGSVIMTCSPFVHVLSGSERGKRCDQCFRRSDELRKCSKCKVTWYCNIECQRTAWELHKKECKCLMKHSPKIPTESARLLLKLCHRFNEGDDVEHLDAPGIRSFADFKSHIDDIKKDDTKVGHFRQLYFTLRTFTDGIMKLPTTLEISEIFARMCINSFNILDSEMQSIGVGIYLSASIFDHSCEANAVVVFSGTSLEVHALTDIDHEDYKRIYISYTEILAPHSERYDELMNQYYFRCDCERCLDDSLDQLMLSTKCTENGCPGPVIEYEVGDFRCTYCNKTSFDDSYRLKKQISINRTKEALVKIDDTRKEGEYEECLQLVEECLETYEEILHGLNVYYLRLMDRGFDACIFTEDWKGAHQYALKSLPGYLRLYPRYHPSLGLQLLRLGKLELHLQIYDEGERHLEQAQDILRITHGKQHTIYDEIDFIVNKCKVDKVAQFCQKVNTEIHELD